MECRAYVFSTIARALLRCEIRTMPRTGKDLQGAPQAGNDIGAVESHRRHEMLDQDSLAADRDKLWRVALALCGCPSEAEDLLEETVAAVLRKPRLIRRDSDLRYMVRALRNTYFTHHRANRPKLQPEELSSAL